MIIFNHSDHGRAYPVQTKRHLFPDGLLRRFKTKRLYRRLVEDKGILPQRIGDALVHTLFVARVKPAACNQL